MGSPAEQPRVCPVEQLVAELDAHTCDGVCTDYKLGSGRGTARCETAASLRILLFRAAYREGLDAIPQRLQFWVVGPSQRRFVAGRWVHSDGPNGRYWSKRERGLGGTK